MTDRPPSAKPSRKERGLRSAIIAVERDSRSTADPGRDDGGGSALRRARRLATADGILARTAGRPETIVRRGEPVASRASRPGTGDGDRPFAASKSHRTASRMSLSKKLKVGLDETRILILVSQILLGFQLQGAFRPTFEQLRFTAASSGSPRWAHHPGGRPSDHGRRSNTAV